MTDQAITEVQPAAKQPNGIEGRSEPKRVTGKLKVAVDAMVYDGLTYQEAAARAGLTARAMRMALERPHVIRYLKVTRDVFRAAISSANIFRLAAIRDQDDNRMAALGAIKVLEQIDDDSSMRSVAAVRAPGVTIIIQQASHMVYERADEAKPLIEHTSLRDDEAGHE